MPKLQFSKQIWLLIAICAYLVPLAGVYFFYLTPLFEEASQAREDSLATEEYTILKNTASQLAQFKERISDRHSTQAIQTALDSMAIYSDVKIVDVRADTTVEQLAGGFLLRGYMITVEGQYIPLNEFILRVEQENNYFSITNFTIVRVDDQIGKARAQYTLRVLTVPEQKKMATPPQTESKPGAFIPGRYHHTIGVG